MVLISSKKYACETCIKGHRSSICKHTDRPLFEIKKKGRPVTQCDHCRELRKTKQVHVKCLCGSNEEAPKPQPPRPPLGKKGGCKVPETAAFPLGLPEALGASLALTTHSEGSESDHSVGCACLRTGECNCCTPRKPAPRIRNKSLTDTSTTNLISKTPSSISSGPPSSQVLARIAEFRPVRPRPTPRSADVAHDPSSGIAHGQSNLHSHESMHFSPYGRAYGYNHSDSQLHIATLDFASPSNLGPDLYTSPVIPIPDSTSWMDGQEPSSRPFPSLCGCGDSCRCPGCAQHNNNDNVTDGHSTTTAYASCTKPESCNYCLECLIQAMPPATGSPVDELIAGESPQQADTVNDWLRQLESAASGSQIPSDGVFPLSNGSFILPTSVSSWDNFQIPRVVQQPESKIDTTYCCMGGVCQCQPGTCQCDQHSPDGFECGGGGLTFATSGERLSVCEGTGVGMKRGGVGGLSVPESGLRSRVSSSSSGSQPSLSRVSSDLNRNQNQVQVQEVPQLAELYSKETLSIPGNGDGGVYAVSNPDSESSFEEIFAGVFYGSE